MSQPSAPQAQPQRPNSTSLEDGACFESDLLRPFVVITREAGSYHQTARATHFNPIDTLLVTDDPAAISPFKQINATTKQYIIINLVEDCRTKERLGPSAKESAAVFSLQSRFGQTKFQSAQSNHTWSNTLPGGVTSLNMHKVTFNSFTPTKDL